MAQFLRHRSRLSCNTVVHATRVAVSPVDAAFERHWPEAETIQLLDESLARDLDAIGHLTPELSGRIGRLCRIRRARRRCGDSLFMLRLRPGDRGRTSEAPASRLEAEPGDARRSARARGPHPHPLDVQALGSIHAKRTGTLAAHKNIELAIDTSYVAGALDALQGDEAQAHDSLIAEAATGSSHADVVLLAQFSTARALDAVSRRVDAKVLSSPDSAVLKLKRMMRPSANGHGAAENGAAAASSAHHPV